jgi:predicted DsbA family dithiol-disulfide isomerase
MATLRPESSYLHRIWKESVYPLARQLGVVITLPGVSPQPHTGRAFEGYQYAKEHGRAPEYTHRVLRAFFQEEQDIGKLSVLVRLARDVGLDPDEFRAALQARQYGEAHREALHYAYDVAGIIAVPTIIVGEQILSGVQDRQTLRDAINEELREQRRKSA